MDEETTTELTLGVKQFPMTETEAFKKPIGTHLLSEQRKERIIDLIRDSIADHDDAEFVVELVLQSQELDKTVSNAIARCEELNQKIIRLDKQVESNRKQHEHRMVIMESQYHRDRADFLATFMMSVTKLEKIPIKKEENNLVSAPRNTEYEEARTALGMKTPTLKP